MNESETRPAQALSARWIFPVDTPPLPGGTISIASGTIVAVEPAGTRTPDVNLGNVAILPGFVNAHTHLDLTGGRGRCTPVAHAPGSPDFTQWLKQIIAFRRTRTPEQVSADIAEGLAEAQRFGTTLIGDISADGASWNILAGADCRAVVFRELLGLTQERAEQAEKAARAWLSSQPPTDYCRPGLSPHAPYSMRSAMYSVIGAGHVPTATHLAESPAELELLRSHSGPFVDFLKELGVWDGAGLVADPLEVLNALPRGIFVHGNFLDPATQFLPTQSVVVCPRTHAAFGHPRHPFPQFLEQGVRVALGTDSLASNPDLDILAEARFLRREYPEVDTATLLRMLTMNGAEALGFGAITGSLTPGKSADLAVLPLPDEDASDPHDLVLRSALAVERVMFQGKWSYFENRK